VLPTIGWWELLLLLDVLVLSLYQLLVLLLDDELMLPNWCRLVLQYQ